MPAWTASEIEAVEELLAERAEGLLRPGERIRLEGESEPNRVEARLILEGGESGERVTLDARCDLEGGGSEEDARDLVLDALDMLLLEWLESGRGARLPGIVEERELRGRTLWIRAQRSFPGLESQADALLGEKPD